MVALNFNADTVAPNAVPEPVPSGIYDAMLQATVEKANSQKTGFYLEFDWVIQGGEFNGRHVKDRVNNKHPNPQTVEIANGTISAIMHCMNRRQIQDTQQLHGGVLKIVVTKEPRDDRPGTFSNNVIGYKDTAGNDPGKSGAAGSQQQAAPSWAGGGAPQGQPQGQPQYQGQPGGYVDPNAGYGVQQGQPQGQQYQPQQQQYGAPQGQPAYDPNAGQNWQGQPQQQQPPQGQPQYQQQPPQGQPQYQGQPQQGQPTYPPQGQPQGQPGGPAGAGGMPSWAGGGQ